MEQQATAFKNLFTDASRYLETKGTLIKLKVLDKSASFVSSLAAGLLIFVLLAAMFLFVNVGVALWVGKLLGETFIGFFCVAGFYMLLAVLFLLFRKKWFKNPINNFFIKKLLE